MMLKVDLHLHTTESDGILTPEVLVSAVAAAGLDYFSITDHDTLAMYERHGALLQKFGRRVISGVEVSTNTGDREVHILGYGVPVDGRGLNGILVDRRQARRARAQRILALLQQSGAPISMRDVEQHAGAGMIGRPHIARTLVEHGFARDVSDAFDRFIGAGCAAYVPSSQITPQQAISAINESGGVSVLAHPTRNAAEECLDDFIRHGLQGIEVYSTSHTVHDAERLRARARKHNLVMTAGTDFHGPTELTPSPGVDLNEEDVAGFLARVGA